MEQLQSMPDVEDKANLDLLMELAHSMEPQVLLEYFFNNVLVHFSNISSQW